MSSTFNAPSRPRPASVRSAKDDDSEEEYGPASYAKKGRQMSSSTNERFVPKFSKPKAKGKATGRQNSLGISPAAVKRWLADEPPSNTRASASGQTTRKLSTSADRPIQSHTPRRASHAKSRGGSRSGSVDLSYTIRAQVGNLDQSISTNNNEVLPISTSNGMNAQVQNIARQILAAGGSAKDIDAVVKTLQRRGSGSIEARRSSLVDIEAGNGYFDIKTTSVGIDPKPSTPLVEPRGRVAHSVYNSSTPGGTNSLREELSQTPGGSKLWTRNSTQRMPLDMSAGQGVFNLKASLRRTKKPHTAYAPATAQVDSSATWSSLNVSQM